MCLLCVFEPGASPTKTELMHAADSNPHGYGFAFMTDDRILTGRGMDAEEVIDRFLRIREGFPNTWAMFHARYTTHGLTNKANCHPFRVGGDVNTVLAHNGILDVDVPKWEDRSDTRIFAEDILPEFMEWLDDPDGFDMLSDWAGGNKIAIFTMDERMANNVYIINEHLGHWDKGRWWSNNSYKESPWARFRTVGYKYMGQDLLDDDDITPATLKHLRGMHRDAEGLKSGWWKHGQRKCVWCYTYLDKDEWEYGYCITCKTCLECTYDIAECACVAPASAMLKDAILADKDESDREYKLWWQEPAFADQYASE